MVVSAITITPPPSRREEVLELLHSIQGPAQVQPGCMFCRIYLEQDEEDSILLFEQWTSPQAFSEWVRSDLYRRVLTAIELSNHTPVIAIHEVSKTQGLDLVRQLRHGGEDPIRPGNPDGNPPANPSSA